jgi:hypothetical protein
MVGRVNAAGVMRVASAQSLDEENADSPPVEDAAAIPGSPPAPKVTFNADRAFFSA